MREEVGLRALSFRLFLWLSSDDVSGVAKADCGVVQLGFFNNFRSLKNRLF